MEAFWNGGQGNSPHGVARPSALAHPPDEALPPLAHWLLTAGGALTFGGRRAEHWLS